MRVLGQRRDDAEPGRGGSVPLRVLRAFSVAVLTLVLAELVLRVTLARPPIPWDPVPFHPMPHEGRLEHALTDRVDLEGTPVLDSWLRERFVSRRPERGCFRIVVVGESAVYGFGMPLTASAPWRLERLLEARFPSRRWEVLNLGNQGATTSIHSDNLRAALDQAAPDLVIIQAGNNEFTPLYCYHAAYPTYDARADSGTTLARSSYLYGLLYARVTRWAPSPPLQASDDIRRIVETGRQDGDAELVEQVYEHNLREMCTMCRQAGIPVLLCTIPINRCWPASDLNLEGATPELRRIFERVRCLRVAGETSRALVVGQGALGVFDNPMLHFETGMCLHALGQGEAARRELEAAMLADRRPSRALPWEQEAVKRVGRELGVPLCDVLAGFDATSPTGVPSEELFIDGCHPDARGARLNAHLWLEALVEHGMLPGSTGARSGSIDLLAAVDREQAAAFDSVGLEDFPGHRIFFDHVSRASGLEPRDLDMLRALDFQERHRRTFSEALPPLTIAACRSVPLLRLYADLLATDDALPAALACLARALALEPEPPADLCFDTGLVAMLDGRIELARRCLARGLALRHDPVMARRLRVLDAIKSAPPRPPLPTAVP